MPAPKPALPVTIIGGYLGAGKTTLVNHLLRQRDGRRMAVLVNDFGELSIDADLIDARDGDLLRLAGGCICCAFGSDLMAALLQMRDLQPAADHILIETSGVALPGAVARTLSLVGGLMLDAVLVLADAESLRERAADRYVGDTVRQQLREADLIVLNKTDLVSAAALAELRAWLAGWAGNAPVLCCELARLDATLVLGIGLAELRSNARSPGEVLLAPLAATASAMFESLTLEFGHAVDIERLASSIMAPSLGLLRAKGLMRDQAGRTQSLQLVGARVVFAASAHERPDDGRLVCIGLRNRLDAAHLRRVLRDSAC